MSDPEDRVELRLEGSSVPGGEIEGSGRLLLHVADASTASLEVDYSSPDEVLVSLRSRAGIRLSADESLVLTGGLERQIGLDQSAGEVGAELRFGKGRRVKVEQEFRPGPDRTSMEVSLTF